MMASAMKKEVSSSQGVVIYVLPDATPTILDALFFYTAHQPVDACDAIQVRRKFDKKLTSGKKFSFDTVNGVVHVIGVKKTVPGVFVVDANTKLADLENVLGVSTLARLYRDLLKQANQWSLSLSALEEKALQLEESFPRVHVFLLQTAACVKVAALTLRSLIGLLVKDFKVLLKPFVNVPDGFSCKLNLAFKKALANVVSDIQPFREAIVALYKNFTVSFVRGNLYIASCAGSVFSFVNDMLQALTEKRAHLGFAENLVVANGSAVVRKDGVVFLYGIKRRVTAINRLETYQLGEPCYVKVPSEGYLAIVDGEQMFVFEQGDSVYAVPFSDGHVVDICFECERRMVVHDQLSVEQHDAIVLLASNFGASFVDDVSSVCKFGVYKLSYGVSRAGDFVINSAVNAWDILKFCGTNVSALYTDQLATLLKLRSQTFRKLCFEFLFKAKCWFADLAISVVSSLVTVTDDLFCQLCNLTFVVKKTGVFFKEATHVFFKMVSEVVVLAFKTLPTLFGAVCHNGYLIWTHGSCKYAGTFFEASTGDLHVQVDSTVTDSTLEFFECEPQRPSSGVCVDVVAEGTTYKFFRFKCGDNYYYAPMTSPSTVADVWFVKAGGHVTLSDEVQVKEISVDTVSFYLDVTCCGEPWTTLFRKVYKDPIDVDSSVTVEELHAVVYEMAADVALNMPSFDGRTILFPPFEETVLVDKAGDCILKVQDCALALFEDYDSEGAEEFDDDDDESVKVYGPHLPFDLNLAILLARDPISATTPLVLSGDYVVFLNNVYLNVDVDYDIMPNGCERCVPVAPPVMQLSKLLVEVCVVPQDNELFIGPQLPFDIDDFFGVVGPSVPMTLKNSFCVYNYGVYAPDSFEDIEGVYKPVCRPLFDYSKLFGIYSTPNCSGVVKPTSLQCDWDVALRQQEALADSEPVPSQVVVDDVGCAILEPQTTLPAVTELSFVVGDLYKVLTVAKAKFGNFVLVNAANVNMQHGGGIAAAIASMAGCNFVKFCNDAVQQHGALKLLETPPFSLKDYGVVKILNVVGPKSTDKNIYKKLCKAYASITGTNCVVPVLSSGIFGVDFKLSIDAFYESCGSKLQRYCLFSLQQAHADYFFDKQKPCRRFYVTSDGVSFKSFKAHLNESLAVVVGCTVYARNKQVQLVRDLVEDEIVYIPTVDQAVLDFYGLDRFQFVYYLQALGHEWKTYESNGVLQLEWQANNCFINAALVALQVSGMSFNDGFLKQAWASFLGGDPTEMVAWCYGILSCDVGRMENHHGIVTALLRQQDLIAAFVRRRVTCSCGTVENVLRGINACYQPVMAANMAHFMTQHGVCHCGGNFVDVVVEMDVPYLYLVTAAGPKVVQADGESVFNACFEGSINSGHLYVQAKGLVFDNLNKKRKYSRVSSYIDAFYSGVKSKVDCQETSLSLIENVDEQSYEQWYSDNYYQCLAVDDFDSPADVKDEDTSVSHSTQVFVRGLKQPLAFNGVVFNPTDNSVYPKLLQSLTVYDLYTMWLENDVNYVVLKANKLSDMCGAATVQTHGSAALNMLFTKSVLRTVVFKILKTAGFVGSTVAYTTTSNVASVVRRATRSVQLPSFSFLRGFSLNFSRVFLWNVVMFLWFGLKCTFLALKPKHITSVVTGKFNLFLTLVVIGVACYNFTSVYTMVFDFLNVLYDSMGTSLCEAYSNYTHISFNAMSYCKGSLRCLTCLRGLDSLHLYKHAYSVEQVYKSAFVWDYTLFVYLFVVLLLSRGCFLASMAFYTLKVAVVYFGFFKTGVTFLDWTVYTVLSNFNFVGFALYVWVMWRIFRIVRHVFYCKDVNCVYCGKLAKNARYEVTLVVAGKKHSVYVYTNAGYFYCKQHNWYCRNCNKFGHQNTFISPEVAGDLSDKLKRRIMPTSVAYAQVNAVDVNNDYVTLKYMLNGAEAFKGYTMAEFLKAATPVKEAIKCENFGDADFIVCDTTSSALLESAKNAAIFYAQLLCKPILIVDQQLYDSVIVQPVSANTIEDILVILGNIVSITRENLNLKAGSIKEVLLTVTDDVGAVDCALFCHNYNLSFTNDGYTNVVPSYGFDTSKLSARDRGFMINAGASIANLKIRNAPPVVWRYSDLKNLSETCLKYLFSGVNKSGSKFFVTRADCKQVISCHTAKLILDKNVKAGGVVSNFWTWIWRFCLLLTLVFVVCSHLYVLNTSFNHGRVETSSANFKVIDNGVIRSIVNEDSCFSNKYVQFDNFLGRDYVQDNSCPIVVAVNFNQGVIATGVPGFVGWHDANLILHSIVEELKAWYAPTWFADDAALGFTQDAVINGDDFYTSVAIFAARCLYLKTGTETLYCFGGSVDVSGAEPFSVLVPHRLYLQPNGVKVSFPKQLLYNPYVVQTVDTTYCRAGVCEPSKAGYCVSLTGRWLLYNDDYLRESGNFCGGSWLELFFNMVNAFIVGVSPNIYMHIAMMFVLLCIVIILFLCILKFQGIFKAYAMMVFSIIVVWLINIFMVTCYSYNPFVAIILAIVYCYWSLLVSRNFAVVMHLWLVVTFYFIVPMWIFVIYVVFLLYAYTPLCFWCVGNVRATKKLYENGEFVGSYDIASQATFVIRAAEYCKLANEVGDKLDAYLAAYARLKYYSGTGGDEEYRQACRAWLAYALNQYQTSQVEVLYTPPKFAIGTTRLQAGFKKLVAPSSGIENVLVMVRFKGNVLNGIWLNDLIYCPRHVIGKYSGDDWQNALHMANNFDFEVISNKIGGLSVIERRMQGALLVLRVNQSNKNTPKFKFVKAHDGDTFTIACSYNGVIAGLYPCTLRANGTIKGSFGLGSCGSIGYNLVNGIYELCYMHHLELPGAIHAGTDLSGNFYGDFVDEEKAQFVKPDPLIANNVVAWLYAAIINYRESHYCYPKWLESSSVSLEEFNAWAKDNGFTSFIDGPVFQKLASITGVELGRVLRTILTKHACWGNDPILGSFSFDDEITPFSVVEQCGGVVLQSNPVKRFCVWWWSKVMLAILMAVVVIGGTFNIVPTSIFVPYVVVCFAVAGFISLTIKHSMAFMDTYLLPVVCVVAISVAVDVPLLYNGLYYQYLNRVLEWAGIVTSNFNVWKWVAAGATVANACRIIVGCFSIRTASDSAGVFYAVLKLCTILVTAYRLGAAYAASDYDQFLVLLHTNLVATFSGNALFGIVSFNVIRYCVSWLYPIPVTSYFMVGILNVTFGWFCCCYFGLYWWLNRVFGFTLGRYVYKVSVEQYKYMNVHKIRSPRNAWDVFWTNTLIAGIGGERVLPVAYVQSKLTDVKCSAVVLMQLLTKLNIEANSRVHKHLVELHNKLLAEEDLVKCMEYLLGMLVTLLAMDANLDLQPYCEDVLTNNTVLQAVVSEFSHIPSYTDYEKARAAYEEIQAQVKRGIVISPQEVAAYRKAANIAKATFDRDLAVQKKLDAMAERAMTSMYKEARVNDRKAKLVSSLHALLFSMLKKIDSDKLNTLFEQAQNGVVPLASVPIVCSNKLTLVIPDLDIWNKCVENDVVTYSGVVWNIDSIFDGDDNEVKPQFVRRDNITVPYYDIKPDMAWPLKLSLVRNTHNKIVLQNNELMPTGVKTAACVAGVDQTSCNVEAKCYYTNINGAKVVAAITSLKADLRYASFFNDAGKQIYIELDPPCKFGMNVNGKVEVVYLYFIKNTRSIVRGMVLGAISNVVVLQGKGHDTEEVEAVGILSLCSFAVDPASCYKEYIAGGGKPLANCVKMLTVHNGSGFAITTKPSPTPDQDSYGGASVCLYCRAHVAHPNMDGKCPYKGSFVQIPSVEQDPVMFCLINKVCNVCQCWIGYGCKCDELRPTMQFDSYSREPPTSRFVDGPTKADNNYLNGYGVAVRLG
ncbi:polyprotein 1a [Gammacoronavirus brantae]|uniref:Polyprotein 1a n=2 Tax=Canada goose coronavirus TaxID=2569586 RepID=A0A4D6FTD3_9GAMC|nr:ORF1a polyprotein [Canada goose coronavirus]QCB65092.1 polyprotein 1a [Canada goose coronavirus]